MSFILLIVFGLLNSVVVSKADLLPEVSSKFIESFKNEQKQRSLDFPASRFTAVSEKKYFENDNVMRFPEQLFEEKQKKTLKKSPKRTIQKIIKRNRYNKIKKVMSRRATTIQTPTASDDEDFFDTEPPKAPTTMKQLNMKKKNHRKQFSFARNPMLFQKLQLKKDIAHSRSKRELQRDNMYIINDFDEVTFLSREKGRDEDIVNAHVRKYW